MSEYTKAFIPSLILGSIGLLMGFREGLPVGLILGVIVGLLSAILVISVKMLDILNKKS